MNRSEKMECLIGRLIRESPHCADIPMPRSADERWSLLRSLMNMRHPGPVDNAFLEVQDSLLAELTLEKGIVEALELPAIKGNDRLALWQGDITALRVDAIVNAANSALLGCFQPCHNCIDNAIHTYAGVQLRNECQKIMQAQGSSEATGTAKITRGYNLPAKHVIHTVGPIISGSSVTKQDDRLLAGCYRSCLELAARKGLKFIAFCCISTGVFRFPKRRAARIAVDTVSGYLAADSRIRRVVFNVFSDEDRHIYREILEAR